MSTGCKLVSARVGSARITRGSYKLFFIFRRSSGSSSTHSVHACLGGDIYSADSETITWEATQASIVCHMGCRACSRYWKHVDQAFWWFYRTEKRNRGKICRKLFSRCRGTSFYRGMELTASIIRVHAVTFAGNCFYDIFKRNSLPIEFC